jgi:hypothetical protein
MSETDREVVAALVERKAIDNADRNLLLTMLGLKEEPKRRGRVGKHGTPYCYSRGCRRQECTAANTARQAKLRRDRAADPSRADAAGHGKSSTYKNYGCRCGLCRKDHTRDCAALKAAREKANA